MTKSLKQQMLYGIYYTAIAKYAGIIVSLLITAVLSRLLPPSDFGIIAIATVFIAFFSILSDLGLGAAIVQNKELTQNDLSNLFSYSIYLGLCLCVCFFAFSWLIASFYDQKALITIFQILSINVLFATFNIVPNALLLKNKRFSFIAYRTLSIQIITGIISILTAFLGFGIYALIVSPVLSSIAIFCVNIRQYPQKFVLLPQKESIKKVFSFSVYQFFFSLINYFTRNLDKILVGRTLGMEVLGYYEKSYRLMMMPLQNITNVITPVMHPVFSDYQNDLSRIQSGFLKILKILSFIGFPLSILLYFLSKEIILIIFGDQWYSSISVFQILSLTVGIQIISSTQGSILQSTNNTKLLFFLGLINTAINIIGLFIGLYIWGTIEGVAWMLLVTFFISMWNFIVIFKIVFTSGLWSFIKQLISPLILSAILFISLYFLQNITTGLILIYSFLLKTAIAFIISILYIQITGAYNIIVKLQSILHNLLRK